MSVEKEARAFVEAKTKKIQLLYKQVQLSYFKAVTSGKKELYKQYEEDKLKIEAIFNNKEDFEKVKVLDKAGLKDKLLARQIRLLKNSYLVSQGDLNLIKEIVEKASEVERKFNTFRPVLDGKSCSFNEINKILKNETDSIKLEKAWKAYKTVGESVESDMLQLIKLRNKLARGLGYENYYTLSLEINEQKEEDIEKIFEALAKNTDKKFKQSKEEIDNFISKRCNVNKKCLKPWHYQNAFFQEAPSIYSINLDEYYSENDVLKSTVDFYSSIGIDVRKILKNSDMYEREGKYPHACCIDMDRTGDIRIIMNVRNNERWVETSLHEFGHAIYNKGYSETFLPFLLKDAAHIFVTEAIAQFFGRLSKNINFIKKYSKKNIDSEKLKEIYTETKKELCLRQLAFSRWSFVMFNFERELYKDPDQDLNRLWWNIVKKYQGIDFYRDKPDWASKIHFVSSPVYYHNYLLGELLASQIHEVLIRDVLKNQKIDDFDYSGNKNVGKYLNDKIFRFGASLKWDQLVKEATGKSLSSDSWIKQFIQ